MKLVDVWWAAGTRPSDGRGPGLSIADLEMAARPSAVALYKSIIRPSPAKGFGPPSGILTACVPIRNGQQHCDSRRTQHGPTTGGSPE